MFINVHVRMIPEPLHEGGYYALARNLEYIVRFLSEFQDGLLFGTNITSSDTPLRDFLLRLYRRREG